MRRHAQLALCSVLPILGRRCGVGAKGKFRITYNNVAGRTQAEGDVEIVDAAYFPNEDGTWTTFEGKIQTPDGESFTKLHIRSYQIDRIERLEE